MSCSKYLPLRNFTRCDVSRYYQNKAPIIISKDGIIIDDTIIPFADILRIKYNRIIFKNGCFQTELVIPNDDVIEKIKIILLTGRI